MHIMWESDFTCVKLHLSRWYRRHKINVASHEFCSLKYLGVKFCSGNLLLAFGCCAFLLAFVDLRCKGGRLLERLVGKVLAVKSGLSLALVVKRSLVVGLILLRGGQAHFC